MRQYVFVAVGLLALVACAAPSTSTPTPNPTPAAPPATAPTAIPKAATATPVSRPTPTPPPPNYREIAQPLVQPLGALIIATRNNDTVNAREFLAEFNQAANLARIKLQGDEAQQANAIRSSIESIRAEPRNLEVLERERETLLFIR